MLTTWKQVLQGRGGSMLRTSVEEDAAATVATWQHQHPQQSAQDKRNLRLWQNHYEVKPWSVLYSGVPRGLYK